VRLQLLRREVQIIAAVRRRDEVVRGYQVEPECILIVGVLTPTTQGSESFEAADQRPSLSGAVWSTLNTKEEDAYLVARPGRL